MIRVLIAEDQAMVLGALAALLSIEPDIEVVGQVGDGRTALAESLAKRPDVVLTDIEMPEMSRLELAAELNRRDLSEGTVRNYLSEAMSKLGARNRVEAARLAKMKGWL